nr:sensor domain-containing diguanylate cyclase [Streptomyces capoamus]
MSRPQRYAPLVLALLCAGYAVGSALGWWSPRGALIMRDFGPGAAAGAAAVSCLLVARSPKHRSRPAWLLFALSSVMAALGHLVLGWYEVVLERPVSGAGYADPFFLCFAPPALVGLLVFVERPVTRTGWLRLGLDTWLVGGSLLTLAWSLALGRGPKSGGPGVARTALYLAYPLLDLVVVGMVLALHFRRSALHRTAVRTALGALALTVVCDLLFTSPLLHGGRQSGRLLDAGWFAGSLLLAYAPWAGHRGGRPESDGRTSAPHAHFPGGPGRHPAAGPTANSLAALTPYLAAAVCTLGILYDVLDGHSVDRVVLGAGGSVVLALVVRQGLMLLDNISLTQELAQKESHFRSLVQGSSDMIMIAAPNGILRYVSPAASAVLGREADELVGTELALLIHPEDLGSVVHEIRRFLAADPGAEPTTRIQCRFRSGDGGWRNVESTVNRHYGGLLLNSRDVTERVRLGAELEHRAEFDPLTGLANRALFTRRVQQAVSGRRDDTRGIAVLFVDLDDFKSVNDRLGHVAGDELLVRAALRLKRVLGSEGTTARLGGDEFAALVVDDSGRDHAAREQHLMELAHRLRTSLSRPCTVDGSDITVTASIGVASADPEITAGELLRNADLAMYRAKSWGKDRVMLYAPHMQDETPAVARAAGETLEHTLARLLVRLGPPPEPIQLEYAPAGNGDGGARQ